MDYDDCIFFCNTALWAFLSQFSKNYDHLMHVSNTSSSWILCSECTVELSGSGVNEGTGSTAALCICCVKYRY